MTKRPRTQYAWNGDVALAYQVVAYRTCPLNHGSAQAWEDH